MKDTNTTPLLGKQKSCLGAINSRPRNLKAALNDTFDFIEIVNSNWLERRTVRQILRVFPTFL